MQHITYRPIDRQFGCLQADLPPGAPFNRVDPIDGITFGFALETRFPEEVYFGTVDGEVTDDPAIGLRAIGQAEYDAAEAAERRAKSPSPAVQTFRPISKRQFFQALAMPPYSIIQPQEALDAGKTGEIPTKMQVVIDALPEAAQFAATMAVAAGMEFYRDHPLVTMFGQSQGMSEAQIDEFWRFAEGV